MYNNPSISIMTPVPFPIAAFKFEIRSGKHDTILSINRCMPHFVEWGNPSSTWTVSSEYSYSDYCEIEIVFLSVVEKRFYSLVQSMPTKKIEQLMVKVDSERNTYIFNCIIVGIAPWGRVSLWVYGPKKSKNILWTNTNEAIFDMKDLMPLNPKVGVEEFCDSYISNDPQVKTNLETNGFPPRDLFDRYMQQFTYRYVVQFEHWDKEKKEWKGYEEDETKPEFDYIEEALYDGTHDKLHDGGLMKYHPAGKPRKLALQWHIKKSDYSAFLWFDDKAIHNAFEQFHSNHSNSKIDFIFNIDIEKNIYLISLSCEEADKPYILEEDACQLIVFKSKFEHYRSKNYNQPRGAWIW